MQSLCLAVCTVLMTCCPDVQLERWFNVLMSAKEELYRYKGILAVKGDHENPDSWVVFQVALTSFDCTSKQWCASAVVMK